MLEIEPKFMRGGGSGLFFLTNVPPPNLLASSKTLDTKLTYIY